MWNSENPSSRNYGINTRSWVPKSPDLFWTEVQGWYNPTTFMGTEISRYILKQGSGMMQSNHIHGGQNIRIRFEPRFKDDAIHHFHGGRDLRIHFEPKFRDDAIPPHSRGPRPLDTFWTEVKGWCNPTTFLRTKVTESILDKCPRMIQSLFIIEDRGHWITFG